VSGDGEPPMGADLTRGAASEINSSSQDVDILVAMAARRIAEAVQRAQHRTLAPVPPAQASEQTPVLESQDVSLVQPPGGDGPVAVRSEPPAPQLVPNPAADNASPPTNLQTEGEPKSTEPGAMPIALPRSEAAATQADNVPPAEVPPSGSSFPRLTWKWLSKAALVLVGGYFALVVALIFLYRFIPPPASTLMIYQWFSGTSIQRTWVPIESMSPNLIRAVVIAEDWGFCDHYGVDLVAIEKALEQAGEGKIPRGASTISMQVVKNLFLTQSKSYVRKGVEIPLTFVAEFFWSKKRMLEIYLNIAEWGPGVFGAEAAAQHHFSKSAAKLSEREAALLASVLPNPMIRDAGNPGRLTSKKATVIQSRMRAAGPVADCVMPAPRGAKSSSKSSSGWETKVKNRAGAPP
jgi:monofunctional biosynthetic peptidoglycan transglycosylase